VIDNVLKSYLEHICGASNVRENEPMSAHTTIRIGGPVRFYVTCTKKEILVRLISALKYIEYPYKVIGAGSNLLVNDNGYDGVIIRPIFCEIVENGNFIYADAGAILSAVAKYAADKDLGGLEFACGIPGTVGGAVYMNAGAHGSSISNVVSIVDVLFNGEIISLDTSVCKFGYRTSIFQKKRDYIILGAYFFLQQSDKLEMLLLTQQYQEKRKKTQPKQPSAGSIFRNPPNMSAAKLIDDLGLKGCQIGGAAVSTVHANFIVDMGGATARDVRRLVLYIRRLIKKTYGITLRAEVDMI